LLSLTTFSTSYASNCLSLTLLGRQQQQQSFNDSYTALILEEAEKIYNRLATEVTNRVMAAAAAAIRGSLLPSANNNIQQLTHKNDMYQREESKYNQLQTYNNDKE
jgi:hypothetical protein